MIALFVVTCVVGVGVVAFLAYAGSLLLRRRDPPITRLDNLAMLPTPRPVRPRSRLARGSTPPIIRDPTPPGVVCGTVSLDRDDPTDRDVPPDARFSIRRSSQRRL